jgi:hypothetical protein
MSKALFLNRAASTVFVVSVGAGVGLPIAGTAQIAEPLCRDLVASQLVTVGSVCVSLAEGELDVRIETTGDTRLVETRVAVAPTLSGFPLSESGVPKLGLFPHASTHQPPASVVPYRIPIDETAHEEGQLLIAVHASVVDGAGVEHGAWAAGSRFREPGNPATYFAFPLEGRSTYQDSGGRESKWFQQRQTATLVEE